jgi:hypothetical protein
MGGPVSGFSLQRPLRTIESVGCVPGVAGFEAPLGTNATRKFSDRRLLGVEGIWERDFLSDSILWRCLRIEVMPRSDEEGSDLRFTVYSPRFTVFALPFYNL